MRTLGSASCIIHWDERIFGAPSTNVWILHKQPANQTENPSVKPSHCIGKPGCKFAAQIYLANGAIQRSPLHGWKPRICFLRLLHGQNVESTLLIGLYNRAQADRVRKTSHGQPYSLFEFKL